MNTDKCTICGCTELNLIDGFYYCSECNTQNTAVRETIIEQKTLSDGTFALSAKKRIAKVPKKTVRMSYEWYKWHAANFVLHGLAEELIALGANPTFKLKLLWIWTRYIKKFQNKKAINQIEEVLVDTNKDAEEESASAIELDDEITVKRSKTETIVEGSWRDIKYLSKSVIIAMLYLALNFDNSDIQLSHIYRFIREQRLNLKRLCRFVPAEILVHLTSVQQWKGFMTVAVCAPSTVRAYALSLLRVLDLGTPVVPDLRKMVDNFVMELSLPNDLKPLVHSLMHFSPCDFLDLDDKAKNCLVRIPDYEVVVMAYVLLAVKLCFGLDCDYEDRLSEVVAKINEKEGFHKSHKCGKYSDLTKRLFSFSEWCSYRQYKKRMLCKYCLYMAEEHSFDIDDTVFMEHMADRPQQKKKFTDEISMDLIQKIVLEDNVTLIPREEFVPTVTPITLYSDIIINHCQDPEVKYLLSEDFTQYSLKYAWENLELMDMDTSKNVITGVSENRKVATNKIILGKLAVMKKCDKNYVYIRNCENMNWMNTNRPTLDHVVHDSSRDSDERHDKDSDHGYDSGSTSNERVIPISEDDRQETNSNQENTVEPEEVEDISEILETVNEEDDDKNIFDDSFYNMDEEKTEPPLDVDAMNEDRVEPEPQPNNDYSDNDSDISCLSFHNYNPATFDREQTIKELVLLTCKKYKISVPREYKVIKPRTVPPKRKLQDNMFDENATQNVRKRVKINTAEVKKKVSELMTDYYEHVEGDFFNKLQQQVNIAIQNAKAAKHTENIADQMDIPEHGDQIPDHIEVDLNNDTRIDEIEQSETQNSEILDNLEDSLFEGDRMDLSSLVPESDPKFDAKLYDASQLYLKINDEKLEEDVPSDDGDPELEKIVVKKIEESKDEAVFANLTQVKAESDSEDDVPLSTIKEERDLIFMKYNQEENFEGLVKKEKIQEFKYWCRHYVNYCMFKDEDRQRKFEDELQINTPASFFFVIKECASILDCSVFTLYKRLQLVEEILILKA